MVGFSAHRYASSFIFDLIGDAVDYQIAAVRVFEITQLVLIYTEPLSYAILKMLTAVLNVLLAAFSGKGSTACLELVQRSKVQHHSCVLLKISTLYSVTAVLNNRLALACGRLVREDEPQAVKV